MKEKKRELRRIGDLRQKRRKNRMLSALTGTCILTERVGSVQDAGFFTGGNFKSEAAKSISDDDSDGSEDPKGAL